MTPERWQQVRGVLEQALELAPEEQLRFLDVACSTDPSLRSEVESFLSSAKNALSGFLDTPPLRASGLTPGTKLGDYEIVSQLGSGGMGVVYRARDLRLGRVVAIKILPPHFSSDANRLKRFEQEAKAAAALNHPHILAVYQLGTYEGVPYLVSELLEGNTLREELKHGALPQQRALDYGEQIADGLNTAHELGIIHRDLKPENLFVTKENRVKILDFGLAKLLLEDGSAETPETPETLKLQTHPGIIAGTVGYMSPEQVRGEKLDARTDLFSFGVALYEMVTGERPFHGDTSGDVFAAILNFQPVPPTRLNSHASLEFERIINKALEKDREVRYQHACEIRADLNRLKHDTESGHTVSQVAPASKKSRAIYWLVPVLVVILLALTSSIILHKRPWSRLETKKQMVLRDITGNSIENPVEGAVISPDGTQLALVDKDGVSLQQISTGVRRVLYKGSDLGVISWYPDGAHLLAKGDNSVGLWKLSTFDGKKERLLANQNVDKAALSPDGKWIVFVDNAPGKVWIMGSNGENPIELTSLSKAGVFALAWSPTSRRILYRSWSVDKAAIASCDREGEHEIEIVSNPNLGSPGANDVYWGADGRVFYTLRTSVPKTLDSNIWVVPVDPETGRVTGEPSQVTSYTGLGEGDFSEARNGKELLFYKERRKDAILIADINPVSGELRNATPLSTEGWNAYTPSWTPDGRKLVFYSNVRGELGFYIEDLQTQEIRPLVTGVEDFGYGPALGTLTSDGKWLLFTRGKRSAGESAELLRMPLVDGPATHLLTGDFMAQCALRTPVCVLCDKKTDRPSFFHLDPIHGRGALLAHVKSLDPIEVEWSLSPDGKNVAYLPEHNGNQIEILSLEGKSSRTIVLDRGHLQSPTWAADNEHFYVVSNQQGKWNMLYVEPSGKYKTALTSPPGDVWITDPSPSPDGRRLAFRQTSYEGNYGMLENY